jgi:hypothetical protein
MTAAQHASLALLGKMRRQLSAHSVSAITGNFGRFVKLASLPGDLRGSSLQQPGQAHHGGGLMKMSAEEVEVMRAFGEVMIVLAILLALMLVET